MVVNLLSAGPEHGGLPPRPLSVARSPLSWRPLSRRHSVLVLMLGAAAISAWLTCAALWPLPLLGMIRPADGVTALCLVLLLGVVHFLYRHIVQAGSLARQLHSALESLPGCSVFSLDSKRRILAANFQVLRSFGYRSDELVGQPLTLILPEWEPQPLSSDWLGGDGINGLSELRGRHKNGTEVCVEISHTEANENTGLHLLVLRDIGRVKQTREALRAREAHVQMLIEQLPVVLWTTDGDLHITSLQGGGLAELGLEPQEIVGMTVQEQFGAARPDSTPVSAHQAAARGRSVRFEMTWKGRTLDVRVEPLRNSRRTVIGTVGVVLDVTDREHLRQAQKMEAVGQLAGGVAHDFNNLLTVITGYSDFLLAQLAPADPCREFVKEIQHAGERAAALTRQLLAFSRKQLLAPRILNLNTLVANMNKLLCRLLGEDVELVTSLDPGVWPIKADPGQLEQVLMNLAVNARDAMLEGGRLTVTTASVQREAGSAASDRLAAGRYVLLAVSDTGCGMTDEIRSHVFEPFFTTKEVGKGTGLGLATVYGIVHQSGGHIEVESAPNAGTTFRIYLPAVESAVDADEKNPAARSIPGGTETVLLVEDEDGVRRLAQRALTQRGYRVLEAATGEEAAQLAELHDGPIHLLLSDVVMPGLSGGEVARRVQKVHPAVKVVFMSGYTDSRLIRNGIHTGSVECLMKPFTGDVLAHTIRTALDTPEKLAG